MKTLHPEVIALLEKGESTWQAKVDPDVRLFREWLEDALPKEHTNRIWWRFATDPEFRRLVIIPFAEDIRLGSMERRAEEARMNMPIPLPAPEPPRPSIWARMRNWMVFVLSGQPPKTSARASRRGVSQTAR